MAESQELSIRLHPLVILSASDHFARVKMNPTADHTAHPKDVRAIGAIFGVQKGRTVEVLNSLELSFTRNENREIMFNMTAFKQDIDLYNKVYTGHECLGWYATGAAPLEGDMALHKQLMEYNESPLLLMFNPESTDVKDLPMAVYQSEVHIQDGKPMPVFVSLPFSVETDEAERITVDHAVRVKEEAGTKGSVLLPQYKSLYRAVSMMSQRIDLLHQFLTDVKSGKVKADQNTLRSVRALCNRLPSMDGPAFGREYLLEYNDTLLLTYLASMTKGVDALNTLSDKFAFAMDDKMVMPFM